MWIVCKPSPVPAAGRLDQIIAALPPHVLAEMAARGSSILAAKRDFFDTARNETLTETSDLGNAGAGAGLVIFRQRTGMVSDLPKYEYNDSIRYVVIDVGIDAFDEAVPPTIGRDFVLAACLDAVTPDEDAASERRNVALVYQRLPAIDLSAPEIQNFVGESSRNLARQVTAAMALRHRRRLADFAETAASSERIIRLEEDRDRLRQHNEALQQLLVAILNSTSWRSIRWARRMVGALRGTATIEPSMPLMRPRSNSPTCVAIKTPSEATITLGTPGRPLVVMLLENFDFGGLEKVVLDLSVRMVGRGHRLVILVLGYDGRLAEQARASGIIVSSFGGDVAALEATILELKPAVAFCHHSYSGWGAFSTCNTRIIEVMQNIYHWQRGSVATTDVRKSAWRVVVCSRAVQRYAADYLAVPADKLVLVHNGLDPSGLIRATPAALDKIRRELAETNFVCTSHIWANKCHHTALTAFREVHARFPNTRLTFDGSVGHADVAAELVHRIARDGLGDVVKIINSRTREDISRVYERAHAFILPSIVEGLSIATLEATYFGLPLLLTDTGGARDVLEQQDGTTPFGIILSPPVDMGSVTPAVVDRVGRMEQAPHLPQLIDAMTEIAQNRDLWIDRGLLGIAKSESFTIDRTIQKYEELVDDAIKQSL